MYFEWEKKMGGGGVRSEKRKCDVVQLEQKAIESGSWSSQKWKISIRIRIRIQKSLNPDSDPSYFCTLSENNLYVFQNYTILSSNEINWKIQYNVGKSKIILRWFNNLVLFLSPWIRYLRFRIRIQTAPESGSETLLFKNSFFPGAVGLEDS